MGNIFPFYNGDRTNGRGIPYTQSLLQNERAKYMNDLDCCILRKLLQSTLDQQDRKLDEVVWGVKRTANIVDQLTTGSNGCPNLMLLVPQVIAL